MRKGTRGRIRAWCRVATARGGVEHHTRVDAGAVARFAHVAAALGVSSASPATVGARITYRHCSSTLVRRDTLNARVVRAVWRGGRAIGVDRARGRGIDRRSVGTLVIDADEAIGARPCLSGCPDRVAIRWGRTTHDRVGAGASGDSRHHHQPYQPHTLTVPMQRYGCQRIAKQRSMVMHVAAYRPVHFVVACARREVQEASAVAYMATQPRSSITCARPTRDRDEGAVDEGQRTSSS